MTKFYTVTQVIEKRVYKGGQPRSPSQGGAAFPNFFGTSTYAHNYGLTESDELWCDKTCAEEVVSGGQLRPIPKGRRPNSPKFRGPLTCARMRDNSQISHGAQTMRKVFYTVDQEC